MHISQHRSSVNDTTGVKLPPINCSVYSEKHAINPTGGELNSRVVRDSRSIQSQCLIYRSVPPTPKNFTLTDMIGAEITPPIPVKATKSGLAGSTSSEFAKRFMSRPTRQPKVVEFNIGRHTTDKRRRGINGFFPSVKLRTSAKTQSPASQKENREQPESAPTSSNLQLVPTTFTEVQPKSASRSISRASKQSLPSRRTPESIRTAPAAPEAVIVYPETFECDDLSYLPPPKRILPKRDVPWVFRYKVKRNMNELSKIMASKPQQVVDA